MAKLSVVIPSRNELFLAKTVEDLLSKAAGEIEVIAVLDGYWPKPALKDHDNLVLIHRGKAMGMRAGINAGATVAKGEYLMKCDAHCMFAEGFDEVLKKDCDDDWLVIPRRKRLDPEGWGIQDVGKPDVDYEFLSYPFWKPEAPGMHGTVWNERIRERFGKAEYDIDDNMSFQGSCWFMKTAYFRSFGGLKCLGYGTFIGEPQEIGLQVWLSGGANKINKKTWYAHLHKGSKWGRMYPTNRSELKAGNAYSVDFWYNNRWQGRTRDIEWLVDHFWPVPTWPTKEREGWEPLN